MSSWILELKRKAIKRRTCFRCGLNTTTKVRQYRKDGSFTWSDRWFKFKSLDKYSCFKCHQRVYRATRKEIDFYNEYLVLCSAAIFLFESAFECARIIDICNVLPSQRFPDMLFPWCVFDEYTKFNPCIEIIHNIPVLIFLDEWLVKCNKSFDSTNKQEKCFICGTEDEWHPKECFVWMNDKRINIK